MTFNCSHCLGFKGGPGGYNAGGGGGDSTTNSDDGAAGGGGGGHFSGGGGGGGGSGCGGQDGGKGGNGGKVCVSLVAFSCEIKHFCFNFLDPFGFLRKHTSQPEEERMVSHNPLPHGIS